MAGRSSRLPAGFPVGTAAVRVLRLLLPICLVGATFIVVQGLFRVVGQPAGQPLSQHSPSLRLDAPRAAPTAAAVPRVEVAPPRPVAEPTKAPIKAPVVVVNASELPGLAGHTASVLRRLGVTVASIGNLEAARRPTTRTVFYPPGGRAQAEMLANLSDARSVAPAPRWLRPDGKLILVVIDASAP